MSENKEPVFLQGEHCCVCAGPILAEPYTRTEFVEETLDYVSYTYWPCYACGAGKIVGNCDPYTL